MILKLLMTAAFGLSFFGWAYWSSGRMRAEFAIGFSMASIVSLLLAGGILNLLPESAALCFAGGLVLLVLSLRRRQPLRPLLTFGTVFFAVCCGLLLFLLPSRHLTIQDNFDHWATLVRQMLAEDRLPNFTDPFLVHVDYPPGTALWVYYGTRITGLRAEWVQMLLQDALLLGLAVGVFPFAERIEGKVAAGAGILMLACGNTPLSELLVDTVLAAAAVGALAFGMYCREDPERRFRYLVPVLVLLVLVKNSGLLFAVLILLFLLPGMRLRTWAPAALCPAAVLLLWHRHVALVFYRGLQSKHALSLSRFRSVFGEKTGEEVRTILHGAWLRECRWDNPALWLLGLALLLLLCALRRRGDGDRRPARLCVLAVLGYILHQLGLWATYLVSMPTQEALGLSWYTRYQHTALGFSAGTLLLAALILVGRPARGRAARAVRAAALGLACVFLYMGIGPDIAQLWRQKVSRKTEGIRAAMEQITKEGGVPGRKSVLVLIPRQDDPNNYASAMARYLLLPVLCRQASLEELQAAPEKLELFDWLLVPLPDGEIAAWEQEAFGSTAQALELSRYRAAAQ